MSRNEDLEAQGSAHREKRLREIRKISFWNGERKDGEWIREAVHTGVKRSYTAFGKSTSERDENGRPKVVKVTTTEEIYQHDGYRPRFDGEKETRKAFFHRGARVWRS